jgi:predicted restriction endonuclease
MELNTINLGGINYKVLDVKEVAIADSFVKKNKLLGTEGHGEARLYLGSTKNDWKGFFNQFHNARGLFYKPHLIKYLEEAKLEYEEQEQAYRKDISNFWPANKNAVNALQDIEYFRIDEANGIQDKARFYIRSNDKSYDIFRTIILPIITTLSILKLETDNKEIFFLFRPFIDYFEDSRGQIKIINEQEEQIKQSQNIQEKEKEIIIQARKGQGKWRESLIDELSCCIITKVNDERLLIASHIKPWVNSNEEEKIDKNNGLLLTPTYDKLFDRGFITFLKTSEVLVSPYISNYNIGKLKIPSKCDIIFNTKRLSYLEYHKENIFKKG